VQAVGYFYAKALDPRVRVVTTMGTVFDHTCLWSENHELLVRPIVDGPIVSVACVDWQQFGPAYTKGDDIIANVAILAPTLKPPTDNQCAALMAYDAVICPEDLTFSVKHVTVERISYTGVKEYFEWLMA
jgi:hypothetical protein